MLVWCSFWVYWDVFVLDALGLGTIFGLILWVSIYGGYSYFRKRRENKLKSNLA